MKLRGGKWCQYLLRKDPSSKKLLNEENKKSEVFFKDREGRGGYLKHQMEWSEWAKQASIFAFGGEEGALRFSYNCIQGVSGWYSKHDSDCKAEVPGRNMLVLSVYFDYEENLSSTKSVLEKWLFYNVESFW